MKVNIYIDGFNFYYCAVKDTPYKWLNLRDFFERSLPADQVNRLKYFTARVQSRPSDPDQPVRQDAYLRALQTLDRCTVHEGTFRTREKPLRTSSRGPNPGTRVWALVTEEKGSDVNLATELLIDGFRGDYEAAVVVSDDSDLISPVEAVRRVLRLPVAILNPKPAADPITGRPLRRRDLERAVMAGNRSLPRWFYDHIDRKLLSSCQFPDPVIDKQGREIHKPARW